MGDITLVCCYWHTCSVVSSTVMDRITSFRSTTDRIY